MNKIINVIKKSVLVIAAICLAAVCLGGCNIGGGNSENTYDQYKDLNEKLHTDYSKIILTVTNTFDQGVYLRSKYTFDYSASGVTVNYNVERFMDISLEGSFESMKTVITGAALIKDGKVVSNTDESVNIPSDISRKGLNFKEEYFFNADVSGVYFSADVIDASGFTGSEIVCSNMKVHATYLDKFFDIKISYTSEYGNSVEYKYEFTA